MGSRLRGNDSGGTFSVFIHLDAHDALCYREICLNYKETTMDIMGLVVDLVGGAIGGNATGAALKDKSLGTLGNTIAGLVGGAAGGYILQAVGVLNSMGLGDMSASSLMAQGGASLVSGGIVTAVVGFIKKAMNK